MTFPDVNSNEPEHSTTPAQGEGTVQDSSQQATEGASVSAEAPESGEALHQDDVDASENETDMSAFEAEMEDSDLSAALQQIDQLSDDLARARAELYNLNQQYGNYVRRAKEQGAGHRASGQQEVVESLLGVLDDIDAARSAGDLAEGPFASIATKLEDTLKTKFQVARFGQAGEDFDPLHHEALLAQDSPDVDHPVVGRVLQPGYRMGEKVLRATKVLVFNPQHTDQESPQSGQ